MSPTLLAAPTNGGTAVSLAFNNHINALIGQVQFHIVVFSEKNVLDVILKMWISWLGFSIFSVNVDAAVFVG